MRLLILASIAVLLALGASPGTAAQGAAGGGFDPNELDALIAQVRQVPLTEDMVDRFVASYPDMKEAGAKFPGTENQPGSEGLDALPPDKRRAMEAVAAKHGFKDLEEWITVTSSVAMSYAYVREGKSPDDRKKMVDAAVAQIENDDKLTQEQREAAIAQYRMLGEKLAKLQPLLESAQLVEKMIGKVAPVMKIQ